MRMIDRTRYILAVIPLLLPVSIASAADQVQAEQAETGRGSFSQVVAKVSPAVVRVAVVRAPVHSDDLSGPKVAASDESARNSTASGSGFLIDPSGYIATNKHVIANTIAVFVITSDGIHHKATVVGMPGAADMALLKIDTDGQKLPFVSFGDSDKMRVGDSVIAVGSPFGFDSSVTSGIVSAVDRDIMESPFDDYIQTDAPINHGNSGGPLFNLAGQVVGMTSVIVAPSSSGSDGIGFAIPSNDLRFVFDRLMASGKIQAGMLPIRTQQVTWMLAQAIGAKTLQGALVSSMEEGGEKMMGWKVKPGDVILSFNGQKVLDPRDLARKAARAPIGSTATLEISRDGTVSEVQVAIHAWPEVPPVVADDKLMQHLGLNLTSQPRDGGGSAVVVTSIDPTGTAADSDLQEGDIILQVQQTPVSTPDDVTRLLSQQTDAKRSFAALLVEHDKKQDWVPIAMPN